MTFAFDLLLALSLVWSAWRTLATPRLDRAIVLFIIWDLVVRLGFIKPILLPPPLATLETIANDIVRHYLGRGFMGEAMVISIDKAAWQQELKLHDELFTQLAHNLPAAMPATKAKLEQRLAA